jgi:hypothetical protein
MSSNLGNPSNGCLIFVDVLGVKGSWQEDPQGKIKRWERVNEIIDGVIKDPNSIHVEKGITIDKDAFSDTLIITATNKNNTIDLDLLGIVGSFAGMLVALCFDKGHLVRGCLSAGQFYRSSTGYMIIGAAVDEAAQYYLLPQWIGISLSPSAHLEMIENSWNIPSLIKYDIPLKIGIEQGGFAVRWDPPDNKLRIQIPDIKQRLLADIRTARDIDIAMKLRNTLNFVTYLETHPRT